MCSDVLFGNSCRRIGKTVGTVLSTNRRQGSGALGLPACRVVSLLVIRVAESARQASGLGSGDRSRSGSLDQHGGRSSFGIQLPVFRDPTIENMTLHATHRGPEEEFARTGAGGPLGSSESCLAAHGGRVSSTFSLKNAVEIDRQR